MGTLNQISNQTLYSQPKVLQPITTQTNQTMHTQSSYQATDFNKTKVNFGGKTLGTGMTNYNSNNNLNKYPMQQPQFIPPTTNFNYNNSTTLKPAIAFGSTTSTSNYLPINSNNITNPSINFGKPSNTQF